MSRDRAEDSCYPSPGLDASRVTCPAPIREGMGGSQKCAHTDNSSSYFIGGGAGGLGVGGESAVKKI